MMEIIFSDDRPAAVCRSGHHKISADDDDDIGLKLLWRAGADVLIGDAQQIGQLFGDGRFIANDNLGLGVIVAVGQARSHHIVAMRNEDIGQIFLPAFVSSAVQYNDPNILLRC